MCNITLSIIIVSYNTKQTTDNCLKSIYNAQWNATYEVIVVDNNSKDGSVEMIKEKYPLVRLISNKDNLLFAKANNQGASIAEGKYLLLQNSDTIIWGDNIQKMIDRFESYSDDVICIGPRILNKDKSLQSCGMPTPGNLMAHICSLFKLGKIVPPTILETILGFKGLQRDVYREVGWVSGACMMIRSSLYHEIGGLNENLVFYGEEPEFGYRALKHKYRTFYYPEAEIIHLGGISTNNENNISDEKVRLIRYAALQKESIGYKKGILFSRIVIISLFLKRLFSRHKDGYTQAIIWERKVIEFLKQKKDEEKTNFN